MAFYPWKSISLAGHVWLIEPPYAEPHVRGCERSAAKAASYSIEPTTICQALPLFIESFHPFVGWLTRLHLCAFWPTREQVPCFCGRNQIDEQDTRQIIVIGIAAIVPHNAFADSLMDEISLFVEENCEAEIIDEEREIR